MQARVILLAVPSLAMAVVGLALFGPGAVRPFHGAQIWGGPTVGTRHLSWRIAVIERLHGIDSTRDIGSLVVRVRAGNGPEIASSCRTRADGTCEVELRLASEAHGKIHAAVGRPTESAPLAEGEFERTPAGWAAAPGHPARLTGQSRGELHLDADARRGIFAAPFRDELVVTVRQGEAPVSGAAVTLRCDAADLDGAADDAETITVTTSAGGQATFGIRPRTHTVDVTLEAAALGLTGSWNSLLPVVPGAIWLDPARVAADRIRVVAPVPREVAYATFATSSARLWGGMVPLSADPRGFAVGEIDWPDIEPKPHEALWLTLASDPRATGMGTVGWPIGRDVGGDARDERPFRDWLLLDGMPAAEQRDLARRQRARGLSGVALGAAAVLEGFLLARASLEKSTRGMRSWAALSIAIATVALAFAAVAVIVIWKTG